MSYGKSFLHFTSIDTTPFWTKTLLWTVWTITILFLIRNYAGPYILRRISNHVRVRSVSLRSIRGIYIRKGHRIWRVDRFGLSYRATSGLTIVTKGVHLEIIEPDDVAFPPVLRRTVHRRLSISNLSPSPLGHAAWSFLSSIIRMLEPIFRPFTRFLLVTALRVFIRLLPVLTHILHFDLDSAIISFAVSPQTKIQIKGAALHTSLQFKNMDDELQTHVSTSRNNLKPSRSFTAWKSRLTNTFIRTWDKTWGRAIGCASISLTINEISGVNCLDGQDHPRNIISSPVPTVLSGSFEFSPKRGSIEPNSIKASLNVGLISLSLDQLPAIIDLFRNVERHMAEPSSPELPSEDEMTTAAPLPDALSDLPISDGELHSPAESDTENLSLKPSNASLPPRSPVSPIINALKSAASRARSRPPPPRRKLILDRRPYLLSVLDSVDVSIANMKLTARHGIGLIPDDYEMTLVETSLGCKRGSNGKTSLHYRHFGRDDAHDDVLDADPFTLTASIQEVVVRRITSSVSHLPLLILSALHVESLLCEWPAPLLAASHFLDGDPNSAFIAAQLQVGSLEVTTNTDFLRQILERSALQEETGRDHRAAKTIPFAMPRVHLECDLHNICGRLVFSGVEPRETLELRSTRVSASVASSYATVAYSVKRRDSDKIPLECKVQVVLQCAPIFLRLRSANYPDSRRRRPSRFGGSEPDIRGEPLISIDGLQVEGDGRTAAVIDDTDCSVPWIDPDLHFLDLHCTSRAVLAELWHPDVVSILASFLAKQSVEVSQLASRTEAARLLDRLPVGVSLKLALERFVVCAATPELALAESDISMRGLVFKSGVSLHYCAIPPGRTQGFRYLLARSLSRHKLYLPEEPVHEAVACARTSSITRQMHAFFRISTWQSSLRSACSPSSSLDDPHRVQSDDTSLQNREFIRIPRFRADFTLSGRRNNGIGYPAIKDTCRIDVHIPYIRGSFQMENVYSVLLLTQAYRNLAFTRRPKPATARTTAQTLAFEGGVEIRTLQLFCNLRNERIALRVNSVSARRPSEASAELYWNDFFIWVPTSSKPNRWNADNGERWEELARIRNWTLSLPSQTSAMTAAGDSLRIRIPYGYVLANLIFDMSVIFKGLKHLIKVTSEGSMTTMADPPAEGPKTVPKIVVRVRNISLEAANDPFESALGLLWRAGFQAKKQRQDREDAFDAKAAVIEAAETFMPADRELDTDYHFNAHHSVSIDEARRRLQMVHSVDWQARHKEVREQRDLGEQAILKHFVSSPTSKGALGVSNVVQASPTDNSPPLFRVLCTDVLLNITPPSFSSDQLPIFLSEHGAGMPLDTEYSLLIPMHVKCSVTSLKILLRDYPLPLFEVPANQPARPTLTFDSDLVIAEEMGGLNGIDWVPLRIVEPDENISSIKPMIFLVPKTIMPVKTYAKAEIRVTAGSATTFAWGQSYSAATQDLTRILDTLTTPPRDSSPPLGFWDKIRLVFHWKIRALFTGEVRLHLKGTRDPYRVSGVGAGFAMCWRGSPVLTVGYHNKDNELMQMISNVMLIVIPRLLSEDLLNGNHGPARPSDKESSERRDYRKICAKFASGVRFGVGFALERTCGQDCTKCSGTTFERQCRYFTFKPHYHVRTELKPKVPAISTANDSYNTFRSDFIHLSLSLTSKIRVVGDEPDPSSLHLSPRAFTHFWSWWSLFDSALSLPIRQGSYYPSKLSTPKFNRHLATIKYRLSVFRLFISHVYLDDSRESWVDGVTPYVGVKAMIDEFQADLHQRDQESIVPGKEPDSIKVVRHKPFYAAEVNIIGMDLRTLLAIFQEPLKRKVPVVSLDQSSNYRTRNANLPLTSLKSAWYDIQDYLDIDWEHSILPSMHLLSIASCPRITYIKRNNNSAEATIANTKFGDEQTHTCLLGGESSVPRVQMSLAEARLEELRAARTKLSRPEFPLITTPSKLMHAHFEDTESIYGNIVSLDKKIELLNDYIIHLRELDTTYHEEKADDEDMYHMPSERVSAQEWADFENVYQIHSPRLFLTNSIRDLLLQYYQLSRAWRGLEYHMATRAVKFIHDQACANTRADASEVRRATASPVTAATVLRRIIYGESNTPNAVAEQQPPLARADFDPLDGWSEGVSLRKGHFVLLLKPQIVLRREEDASVCILAAIRAKLSAYDINDDSNFEDPISGKVMTRNYMFLNGLQTFAPTGRASRRNDRSLGYDCVPLEVLIDYRCESEDFDRLVPQTDATFHYDRFNRLRLGNSVSSTYRNGSESTEQSHGHLRSETDFIQAHVPRFTVSANDRHFQAISNIVTGLLLYVDAGRKTHTNKLETLLFSYDFTNLTSAARVVADLQQRLRSAKITYRDAAKRFKDAKYEGGFELLQLRAHIFLLSDELNLIFEGIKVAQSRGDDATDQKSALLLQASSSEIAWQMLDEHRDLMAKLAVRDINYTWLNRKDSSTVNNLAVGNLQAFDGSPRAVWAEILSKYNEPAQHVMAKRGLFLSANWTVLAPVGGISIYEDFELNLHPIRLQVDAKLGSRIMEYVWPARKNRALPSAATSTSSNPPSRPPSRTDVSRSASRTSIDYERNRRDSGDNLNAPSPVRLRSSRSYTELSTARTDANVLKSRTKTLDAYSAHAFQTEPGDKGKRKDENSSKAVARKAGDAAEMKTRSSQKTFIHVKISSLNLLLSIIKEESFDLRDARIRTRDLEFRNETWSFEELVNQFIPTEMNWRGWVKMAFAQPLVPVLPVARELFSKTKWIAAKGVAQLDHQAKVIRGREDDTKKAPAKLKRTRTQSPKRRLRIKSLVKSVAPPPLRDSPPIHILKQEFVAEPDDHIEGSSQSQAISLEVFRSDPPSRSRLRSLLAIQRPKTAMS